jgi:hypothetical protein
MNYLDSIVGFEAGLNVEINIKPGRGDEDESIQIDFTRQFNIQDQIDSEFWINLQPEFWPEEM